MDMGKVEQLRDEVIGLRPVYCEIGNATELLLKDGTIILDKRTLNSVVKALAAAYAVNLKAQRKHLQEKLDRKGILPFYLGDGRVFIPLKMRQAVTANDAVYGYIDLNYMTEPRPQTGKECAIELINGIKLQVLSGQSTVLGVQHTGTVVRSLLQPDKPKDVIEELIIQAVHAVVNTLTDQHRQLRRIEEKLDRR
ncbi:Uncharacterized [Syntrophomonas zehnderi OL-4]|uniref:Uncharacterized n=1 Tax=Syntrophomonas zehnderi OL-4 TaxID=690567 RepID=A0A0E3W2P0_9FIRM|nr:hypothetical protein [Syntrophomonas zehnderi]CFX11836.1 Uncharacterized [Syntrophomonas zehnderi OL-4]